MLKFILQRVLSMILVVLIVASATFFMMRLLPSGPFAREKELPPQIIKNLEARYHLDDPIWKQYVDYIKNLLRGTSVPVSSTKTVLSTTSSMMDFPCRPYWERWRCFSPSSSASRWASGVHSGRTAGRTIS